MRSDCSWTGVPIDRRVRIAIAGYVLLASLGITAAVADQVVYFVNGKAIMVKSVEKGPKFTTLEVEGGGKIGVPTEQIDRIEEYQISQPGGAAPAIVQAPVAAPQPVLVPPALPVAMVRTEPPPVQASAPLPVGPGLGGKVDPALARSAAALRPINLGGDAPTAPFGPMRAGGPGFAGPNYPYGPGGRGVGPGMAGRMMGGPGGSPGRMGRRGPGGGRALGGEGQQGGSQPPGAQAPAPVPTPAAQNPPPNQPSTQQQASPPQEDPPAVNEPPAENGSETDAPATEEGEPSDGGSP